MNTTTKPISKECLDKFGTIINKEKLDPKQRYILPDGSIYVLGEDWKKQQEAEVDAEESLDFVNLTPR
jgi:hypothetical protein